jgi:glucose/arabinose dehydrogenase
MKKIWIIAALIGIVLVVWVAKFWHANLRGSGPAFLPPIRDIVQNPTERLPSGPQNTTDLPLILPDEFSVSVFAKNLGNPRVLAWDPVGDLLVSVPAQGRIMALGDTNDDGLADGAITVASGLNRPHGIAFHGGNLYIAETGNVSMFLYDTSSKQATNKRVLFDLPAGGNHFSRTIGFGPDGRLYVSVGSSCNVCVESDWRRAAMLVANADGSNLKLFASGLRNSVFFVWHPVTNALWATDMGRDLLGDNTPFEEVNIVQEGRDYGWPYCYNNRVHDDNFDPKKTKSCDTTVAPQIAFQAHSAPLGLAFIPESWPSQYRGDLLVSYHGSWNRTQPTGYKVARFDLDAEGKSQSESDFLSGFLEDNGALGRPVDLVFDTEGNLFISDDKAGVIYRVSQR